ncbi:GtrA-like protein [Variovorax sp. YR752]|uniref:GtrA family protein n=1 Tax=Variovorax sp. YR752 TaxID=1884383 RepID=UPI000BCFE83B|nr:GtrA family protein [Variovorax sp. YR752]SOD22494.1 GtrA-like protein [Variovorax sp. YR752]
MKLAISYAFFALVATVMNIAAQELAISIYDGTFGIPLSVFFGTAVGLVVKYFLDKRYIFRFRTRNVIHSGQTFVLYVLMGLATTTIFWGFEFGFHHFFASREMRYLGGVIGLAIGYIAKYHLDKHYVFKDRVA